MNTVGIFCEDIRDEVGGTHTVIGIVPDNVHLQRRKLPTTKDSSILVPKMGFYVRANLESGGDIPRGMSAEIALPDREPMMLGSLTQENIEAAFRESISNKLPFVGVIFKGVLSPLPIGRSGLAELRLKIDGRVILCGTLNILIDEA
jgi:hypothetical protein